MGPYKTEFREIEAYCRMMGVKMHPWEVRLIRRLAHEFILWNHENMKKNKGKEGDVSRPVDMTDHKGLLALFKGQGQRPPGKSSPSARKAKR